MKTKKLFSGFIVALVLGALIPGLGLAQLTPKWSFTGNQSFSVDAVPGSPAVGDDGIIYAGSAMNGYFFALNPDDGSLKWVTNLGGAPAYTPAIGNNGAIITHNGNVLFSLNQADGSIMWSFSADCLFLGAPAISKEGVIYIGSNTNKLFALDPATGTKLWEFRALLPPQKGCPDPNGVFANPVIDWHGTIYCLFVQFPCPGAIQYQRLYALNPDGTMKARRDFESLITDHSPAIGPDGTIYVGADSLYALSPADLSLKWECPLPQVPPSGAPVIARAGIPLGFFPGDYWIVVPCGTHLVGVSFLSKGIVWEVEADFSARTPAVGTFNYYFGTFGTQGTAFVGQLCAAAMPGVFDHHWMDGQVHSSPALTQVGDQTVLYIGSRHSVSAWNVQTGFDSPGLGATIWPCDRANLKRTGRASKFLAARYQVAQLFYKVQGLHISITASLTAKLESAEQALLREDPVPARNKLNAFINEVTAQKGKKIPDRLAAAWILEAQAIVSFL
jgi:hypothetical protein